MVQELKTMQSGLEFTNMTTLTYLNKRLTGHTVYGDVKEIIPEDIPKPLGNTVTTTTTVDAHLNHCLATGRSLTGCLHFVNQTPIDSFSK